MKDKSIDQMGILRRFEQVGSDENFNKLNRLIIEKDITRDDLILILSTLKLKDTFKLIWNEVILKWN